MDARPHQTLIDRLSTGAWWSAYSAAVQQLASSGNEAGAVAAIRSAVVELGGNAAVYSQGIRYDAALTLMRTLVVGDAAWAVMYANCDWGASDPWMVYALQHATPALVREIELTDDRQRAVMNALARHGLVSGLIVPSPSNVGPSCAGVLCIGASRRDQFDGAALSLMRPVARGLAMEIGDWCLRRLRQELIERAQLSADDISLLRHEARGHRSKVIAEELRITKSTIDSRFHRLNQRLGVATRRDALRVVRLYGLL
jgi:DNA-binding CsgD family transcriptional regulator